MDFTFRSYSVFTRFQGIDLIERQSSTVTGDSYCSYVSLERLDSFGRADSLLETLRERYPQWFHRSVLVLFRSIAYLSIQRICYR